MLKQNKGITMISLVVTVIVLMILASITTYSGISTAKESRYYNAVHQMKVMQSEVNSWYENQKDGDKTEWNKGLLLSSSGKETQCITAYNSAKDNNLNGSDIGKIADFKYFSKEIIKNDLDIEGIDYDFMINLTTRCVILVDGIEKDEKIYYSLGEISGEQYNVDYTE